jgi:nitrogen fixation/metabolism regulation signal transduction histidine kinase
MKEIEVAVFAFDEKQKLRLVNGAGERLLAAPAERLIGASAQELQLAPLLEHEPQQTFQRTFPGRAGRWGVRRTTVREHGEPLQLLVISDLTQTLREEELQAWQRLVRVLGHELNNSLTPIKSIAGSLASLLAREPLPEDWREDTRHGLSVISTRSEALSRFIGAYARLAKLPRPQMQAVEISGLVKRIAGLETRVRVVLEPGPEIVLQADHDQLEQVIINLLKNATEASLETGGKVEAGWARAGSYVEIWVKDEGPGLSNTANLFVPFFTTKPGGSGIGLVLSRQIVEAHGGSLALENRQPPPGCIARLHLPWHAQP